MSFFILTKLLMENKIVVYKSDTIPSIYARLSCYHGVLEIKKREVNKPFVLLVDSLDMLKQYAKIDNYNYIEKIALKPFTTIIYESSEKLKKMFFWKFESVAMRIPHLLDLKKVITKIQEPIISTSYNTTYVSSNLYFIKGWEENINGIPSRIFNYKKKEYIR